MKRTKSSLETLVPLDGQLCFALYACTNALTRAYAPLLDPLRLTYLQYLVALVLIEEGECSVSHLGARLGLDSGTLTPLLKRLEANGIVTRERSVEDARVVRVKLSREGRALEPKLIQVQRDIACRTDLSRDQFIALRESAHALRTQLLKD